MGSGNWQVAKDHKAAFKDLIPEFGGKVRRDWDLTEHTNFWLLGLGNRLEK